MDAELRSYLEGMEQRMLGRTQQIVQEITATRKQEILDQTQEMVRDAQTEVLRGFERYLAGVLIRLRTLEADTSNVKTSQELRLANLEERIIAIELKLMRGNSSGAKPS
jgi:hypothetical protein